MTDTIVFGIDQFPSGLNHAGLDEAFRAESFSIGFRGLVRNRAGKRLPENVTAHFASSVNSSDQRKAADLVEAHSGVAPVARIVATPLQTCTVATLPTPADAGMVLVQDESGGAVLAFSDGTNWRRSTDRAIVS